MSVFSDLRCGFPNLDPRWTGVALADCQRVAEADQAWTSTWRDDVTNSPVQSLLDGHHHHPTIRPYFFRTTAQRSYHTHCIRFQLLDYSQ
ncbi:hypothetical protein PGT21_000422 [Puccinia graminis f. sp. tritici]|uniref:Uncharacterized protein n=1 Tax=Puccinia graminis f. sp. tritici TaxID=56615 RepID=A0A5B0NII6_PUCGR|nr:hypothetical protein PGT21_000422 [Puccinia graminis f. sp. tritici]